MVISDQAPSSHYSARAFKSCLESHQCGPLYRADCDQLYRGLISRRPHTSRSSQSPPGIHKLTLGGRQSPLSSGQDLGARRRVVVPGIPFMRCVVRHCTPRFCTYSVQWCCLQPPSSVPSVDHQPSWGEDLRIPEKIERERESGA